MKNCLPSIVWWFHMYDWWRCSGKESIPHWNPLGSWNQTNAPQSHWYQPWLVFPIGKLKWIMAPLSHINMHASKCLEAWADFGFFITPPKCLEAWGDFGFFITQPKCLKAWADFGFLTSLGHWLLQWSSSSVWSPLKSMPFLHLHILS